MKKVVRMMEGLAIAIGSMLFGYFMLYLFCLFFTSADKWILIKFI